MTLEDDLDQAAVTVVVLSLAANLPDVAQDRLESAAEAAVAAVRPFLDGTERSRIAASEVPAAGAVPDRHGGSD
ncbi:hypothetical protein [Micromonospora sp. CPCC 206061]|uniref:hypothetical protein n=1 Tax=Micromonospora sp. CPCC 206061 TaxID=3122410 RepID=UPI002FF42C09